MELLTYKGRFIRKVVTPKNVYFYGTDVQLCLDQTRLNEIKDRLYSEMGGHRWLFRHGRMMTAEKIKEMLKRYGGDEGVKLSEFLNLDILTHSKLQVDEDKNP